MRSHNSASFCLFQSSCCFLVEQAAGPMSLRSSVLLPVSDIPNSFFPWNSSLSSKNLVWLQLSTYINGFKRIKPGMAMHSWNPNTQKNDAGTTQRVQSQPELQNGLQASLVQRKTLSQNNHERINIFYLAVLSFSKKYQMHLLWKHHQSCFHKDKVTQTNLHPSILK